MSPDAKLRRDVYQEGQKAFNAGTTCPYTDWRAGTWNKGWQAAKTYRESMSRYDPTAEVPCGLCGKPTPMTVTCRCDGCWELEARIRRDPDLARSILNSL